MGEIYVQLAKRQRSLLAAWAIVVMSAAALAGRMEQGTGVAATLPPNSHERLTYEAYQTAFPSADGELLALWNLPSAGKADMDALCRQTLKIFGAAGLADVGEINFAPREKTGGTTRIIRGLLDHDQRRTWQQRRSLEGGLSAELSGLFSEDATVELSGLPAVQARYEMGAERDQAIYMGGGIIACFIVMTLLLRSLSQVVSSLIAVTPAYLVTLAGLAALGRTMTPLTAMLPFVLLLLGLHESAQLLTAYRRERQRQVEHSAAVVAAFTKLWLPSLLAASAVVLVLLSLLGSATGMVVEFAIVAACAAVLQHGFTQLFLPAFLASSWAQPLGVASARRGVLLKVVDKYGAMALGKRRRQYLLAAMMVVMAVATTQLGKLHRDANMLNEGPGHPQAVDVAHAETMGLGIFETSVWLKSAGVPLLPDDSVQTWFRNLRDFIAAHDGAHRLLMPSAGERSTFDPGSNSARLVIKHKHSGALATRELLDAVRGQLASSPPPRGRATITGAVPLVLSSNERAVLGSRSALPWTLAVVVLLVWVSVRSWKLRLFVPLLVLFPGYVGLALTAALGVPVTPSTLAALITSTALCVHMNAHMLLQGRGAKPATPSPGGPLAPMAGASRDAIAIAAVAIGCGFSLPMLSGFRATALLGGFTCLAALSTAVVWCVVRHPAAAAVDTTTVDQPHAET